MWILVIVFPSLSGKTFIRTVRVSETQQDRSSRSFHPFQGRPSFGQPLLRRVFRYEMQYQFPSLSGKTFIRTRGEPGRPHRFLSEVSIPFREDLHSDKLEPKKLISSTGRWFPSLSGKTFIRTLRKILKASANIDVSIPFREDLHSDDSFELIDLLVENG